MVHLGTAQLETPRLLLRRFCAGDASDMLRNWAADPQVQHLYAEPVYETPQAVTGLLHAWQTGYTKMDFYRWAITQKDTGENIGQIAFCRVYADAAEVEYAIGQAFWGRGYTAEALCAVLRYAFERVGFACVEGFHRAANPRSGRVMQKAGMQPVPTITSFAREGREPLGEVCYALTRGEYMGGAAPGCTFAGDPADMP